MDHVPFAKIEILLFLELTWLRAGQNLFAAIRGEKDMNELGRSVFNAFGFLNDFLKDVSKMVTTIEEKMTNNQLIGLGDAATFWDHSRAYYAPGQWLPKYIVRHYAAKNVELENWRQWKVPSLLFIAIYLTPQKFKEPVVVWGSASQEEKKNFWNILKEFGLLVQNPEFLKQVPAVEWVPVDHHIKFLTELKYRSEFLVNIGDATAVENKIIKPLLEETAKFN